MIAIQSHIVYLVLSTSKWGRWFWQLFTQAANDEVNFFKVIWKNIKKQGQMSQNSHTVRKTSSLSKNILILLQTANISLVFN